uniref:M48 metallopeptidase family protein n=1 Tax=uncultured Campylobacter sp. TaxID=218934 RepID=UPI0026105D80
LDGLDPHLYGAKFDGEFDGIKFNAQPSEAKFTIADERKFDGEIYAASLAALENYKKAFARRVYEHFIAKFAPAVNRKINRVVVRKMTTRWGSCNSRKGYINLSLNLIEKAPELVEYVVLHELAHLIYPHHQKSFYGFITGLMPDFKTREQRLNKK